MKKLSQKISIIAGSAVLAVLPFGAFAQTTVNADTGVSVSADVNTSGIVTGTASSSARAAARADRVSTDIGTAKTRADAEITRRITNLTTLSTRIGAMKNVSAAEKTSLQTSISTEISTLTTLKATIDGETVAANIKTDVESITKDYRVYMLILPQGRIAAASDRIATITSEMQQLSVKLSARISAAQTAGKDVSGAQSAYADMQAKIADANTQSQAALSETQNLTPDQGDASVEASNTAAIKDAAAKIKTATADLKAARADIQTILTAVKGTGSVSASSSTSVQ